MRYSNLFAKTKRDAPADMSDETLRLAYRAGLIRPVDHGQLIFLPLAANVISQMHLMLRGDLRQLRAQELNGVTQVNLDGLGSAEIQSYKQLPARVHWTSRGQTRLHLSSFEASWDAALETRAAFDKIARDFFEYTGIQPSVAQDIDGGQLWYSTAPQRDLEILKSAGYTATRAAASPFKAPAPAEALLERTLVETPHCDTIEALAQYLQVPTSRTAKAVFYASGDRVIFAVVRGDLQIDESKVKRALKLDDLRWATDQEIASVGAVPGYASPVGTRGATIIVDDSVIHSPNLVAGANQAGYHLLNTNVPRDFKADVVTDIALARAGDMAPHGGGELELVRGSALGVLSAPRLLDANFLDVNGKATKQVAVTLELDLGAILLAHVAAHHDEKGIVWSRALAPYDVYVAALNADKPEMAAALDKVNDAVALAGLEAFVDDRNDSAGIKFHDADLIGLPLRITIGPKTVAQNAAEFKARSEADARPVALDQLGDELNKWIGI